MDFKGKNLHGDRDAHYVALRTETVKKCDRKNVLPDTMKNVVDYDLRTE